VLNDDSFQPADESLLAAAIGQHEMYLSWLHAGFTPEQAMELLKTVVSEVVRGAS
jgi:hypothetical protein